MNSVNSDFSHVLRQIVDTYGVDILNDLNRVNALLMDYAPQQARERKLLMSVLRDGAYKELEKVVAKGIDEQQLCVKRCAYRLVTELWITEEAAQFAIQTISFAIGLYKPAEIEESGEIPYEKNDSVVLSKGDFSGSHSDLFEFLKKHQCIGYKAFAADTRLIEANVPDGIKIIKPKAFLDCINLKKVHLPNSIEGVGREVFSGCDSLEQISIERNPIYVTVSGLLIDKEKKALLRATNAVNSKCVIQQDINTICSHAFERSSVHAITLPRNLKQLERSAIILCNQLEQFEIDPRNENYCVIDGVLHTRDRTQLVLFPTGFPRSSYIIEDSVSHIADAAFSGAVNIETITFTSSVRSIGTKAFESCMKLSSLMLPSSVTIIGERAFQYCERLADIMLPHSITEIGDYAFCNCLEISNLSIPKNVKRIGHSAFRGCSKLKKVIVQDNLEFIGDGAFIGCSDDLEIVIKNNVYVERYCSAHKIKWSTL